MKDLLKKAKEMKNKKNMNKDLKVQTKVFKETKEENKFKDKKDKLVCSNKHFCVSANKLSLNKGIEFESGSCKVKIFPIVEKQVKGKFLNDKLTYKNYNGKDDLQYTFLNNKLKENIIIKEKKEEYFFEFNLELTNVELLEELGEYYFVDNKTNNKVIKLNQFVMSDSNKQLSLDIESTLTKVSNNLYKLTLKPNKEWLNDKNRVFPVYLDPTLESMYSKVIDFTTGNATLDYLADYDGKDKVGFINDTSYGVTINLNLEEVINNINSEPLSNYRVLFNFKIANGETDSLSGIYSIYDDEEIIYDGALSTKSELTLDITNIVKKAISNNTNVYSLLIRNSYINPESSSENSAEIIENDYIYIYNNKYIDESFHPSLSLERKMSEVAPLLECTRTYSNGNAGTATVDLTDGSFIHELNITTIKENALQIPLNLVFNFKLFNETSIDKVDKHLGKGWKTNLHQYLIKDETYDENEQCRFVNYIDGKGYRHIFKEKWFYEVNGTKHYVDKNDVYFNSDGKLEYDGYKVTYEVENDDNLSLVSYSSMYNYKQKTGSKKKKRFFIQLSNTKLELVCNENNNLLVPHISFGEEIDMTDEEIKKIKVKSFGEANFHNMLNLCEGDSGDDLILVGSSKVYKKIVFSNYNDIIYENDLFKLETSQVSAKNVIYFEQNIIRKNDVYYVKMLNELLKWTDKSTNEDFIECYQEVPLIIEEDLEYDFENYYTFGNDNIGEINFQIKNYESNVETLEKNLRSQYLSLQNSLIQKSQIRLEISEYFKNGANHLSGGRYSYKLLREETLKMIDENNSLLYENILSNEKLLDEYYKNIEQLKTQKNNLLIQEKQKVNDYIVDDSRNILGFDGYGRLILVQDKYENAINIEYGFEDEKNKILSVSTKSQTFVFNYDEEQNTLSKILYPNGKYFKLLHDVNCQLINVQINGKTCMFFYQNNTVGFYDPLMNLLKITYNENKINNVYLNKMAIKITQDNIVGSSETSGVIENEVFHFENYKTTIINGEKNEEYVFDIKGNLLNYNNGKNKISVFNYNDSNKLLYNCSYKESDKLFVFSDESNTLVDNNISKTLTIGYGNNDDINLTEHDIYPAKLFGLVVKLEGFDESTKIETTAIFSNSSTSSTNTITCVCKNNSIMVIPLWNTIKDLSSIRLDISFDSLDKLEIVKELSLVKLDGTLYKYDDNDNIIEEKNELCVVTYSVDDMNNITFAKVINNNQTKTYKYRYNKNKLVTYCEDSLGNCVEYIYNEKNDLIEKKTYNKADASLCIVEKCEYDEYGNCFILDGMLEGEDGRCYNTEYEYEDNSPKIKRIKYANGRVVDYNYDFEANNLKSISSYTNGIKNSNQFDYNHNLLTKMSSNQTNILFSYDGSGRVVSINTGNGIDYVKCAYQKKVDFEFNQVTYTNMDIDTFTYADGVCIKKVYDSDQKLRFIIKSLSESNNEIVLYYAYEYDEKDRLICVDSDDYFSSKIQYDGKGKVENYTINELDRTYAYDEFNRVIGIQDNCFGETVNRLLEYSNQNTNIISRTLYENGPTIAYRYDALNRLIQEKNTTGYMANQYEYLQYNENVSSLIKEHVVKLNNQEVNRTTYDYDVSGNIIKEESDNNSIRYKYDKLNRLIREDNKALNKTFIMKYDTNGNILCRAEYEYSLEDTPTTLIKKNKYSYNKDMLMAFNDEQFGYDVMGRPTVFMGRTIKYGDYGNVEGFDVDQQETYVITKTSSDGFRLIKNSYLAESYFCVDGNNIIHMEVFPNNDTERSTWKFRYSLDKIVGFNYNGSEYVYQKNIQGDVTHIYDATGILVCRYIYDAFGNHKVLTPTGLEDTNQYSIGNLNPIRYRSYFYDVETQLYWVSSRYYSPELCRWISPDSIEYLDPESINGLNLYAYCGNDPVNRLDPTGHFGIGLTLLIATGIGLAFGFGIEAAKQAYNGGDWNWDLSTWNWWEIGKASLIGAATGFAYGLGGVAGGIVKGSFQALTIAGKALTVSQSVGLLLGTAAVTNFAAGVAGYAMHTAGSETESFNILKGISEGIGQTGKGVLSFFTAGMYVGSGVWKVGVGAKNTFSSILGRAAGRFIANYVPNYMFENLF